MSQELIEGSVAKAPKKTDTHQVGQAAGYDILIGKALDNNVPIETLEKLLAMREKLRAEQTLGAFTRALSGFQAEVEVIPKKRTAQIVSKRTGGKFSYQYADLSDIQAATKRALKKYGLAYTFGSRVDGNTMFVSCTVSHVEGHSICVEFPVPIDREAAMNPAQQLGSALTYGRRYAVSAALGIVTEDDVDGRGLDGPEKNAQRSGPQRKSQATKSTPEPQNGKINTAGSELIEAKAKAYKVPLQKLFGAFGISKLEELNVSQVADVLAWIEGA